MDPTRLRERIPALEDGVYLNTGASGPSPREVVEATEDALEYQEYEAPLTEPEGAYTAAFDAYEASREAIAWHVGCSPIEIALTESTTDSINRVAGAFDWREGDVIVRTDLEHAAGILPWERLARHRGVEVRVLETRDGYLDLDDVREAVTDARLVVTSSITWTHGTRLPVSEIVEIAHDAGAAVLVDAVQSPGQSGVDVGEWGAEFVAAAGHKWMLGPFGSGFLYVRDGVADEYDLVPSAIGYRSVEDPEATDYRYKPGARRFEVGTTNPAPHVGLAAAIDLLEAVGLENVERRIERLTDRLKDGVSEDRLSSPRTFESGLVTIADDDPEETVERLAERDIVVRSVPLPGPVGGSEREGELERSGAAERESETGTATAHSSAVRASVHAFNTTEEVDALLEVL